jgi:hypothetical protein
MTATPALALTLLSLLGTTTVRVPFRPAAAAERVSIEAQEHGDVLYHRVSVPGYGHPVVAAPCGVPSLPFRTESFLLPPGTRVDSVEITEARWVSLPGSYRPFPVQPAGFGGHGFALPDPEVYSGGAAYPRKPVTVLRQGFAGGYSVATLCGYPVRYIPAEGGLEVLESVDLRLCCSPVSRAPAVPDRESAFSAAVRRRALQALVSNPADTSMYGSVPGPGPQEWPGGLEVTLAPSSEGSCVDMVIVTSEELEEAFREVADYRTGLGTVAVVRTVDWIEQRYSGCDTQERIRNFLLDAHESWGIQFVLLGGDDDVVPARYAGGWKYIPVPFPSYCLPTDDYYGDLDGVWSSSGSGWTLQAGIGYLDLCTGRWPVSTPGDVEAMLEKLEAYESSPPPGEFARRMLLMGSNNPSGSGADDLMELADMLREHAVPEYLDDPTELYYPHSLPGGDLNRNSALAAMDQGYSMIIHADHAELHKLGTAGRSTLGEYIWDSDFATMGNAGQPSILWTLGCDTGHFDGAFCFAEAGMLTSPESGLLAVIANPRGGLHEQAGTAWILCDALYGTGYTAELFGSRSLHWPLSYLGEAYRISKNRSGFSYMFLNLLGPPLLHVWRGEPRDLSVSALPLLVTEGDTVNVTATVTDADGPVQSASVCLWKQDELFALQTTDAAGTASFEGVSVVDGAGGQSIGLTATRRRVPQGPGSTTDACMPAGTAVEILPTQVPLVSLSGALVDPSGDGAAAPGETVEIMLEARNTGGQEATGVSAQLSLGSGSQYISSIPDATADLPDMAPESADTALDPVAVEISPAAPAGATAELEVLFSYQGPGGSRQRLSTFLLEVESAEYELVCCDPEASQPGGTAVITLDGITLANTGLAGDPEVLLTAGNLTPTAPFSADTLVVPGIPPNAATEVQGELTLSVTPEDSSSAWLREGFPGCSFSLVAGGSGEASAGEVDVHLVDSLQELTISPPTDLTVSEAGPDRLALAWDHGGYLDASGYCAYLVEGGSPERVYPLPVPVRQLAVEGLEPGTGYTLAVTALDGILRESEPAEITATTTRPPVEGWPLNINGSPGAGPIEADMDSDPAREVVLTSSFGAVLIVDRDGSILQLQPPSGWDYDRFLGSAVGDVTGDGAPDVVVAVQKSIAVEDQQRVAILLFSAAGSVWTSQQIAVSGVNEELATPVCGTAPVLLQADSTPELEIALRTRGDGAPPRLYLWRRDAETEEWEDFSDDFPYQLQGDFFAPPAAVDLDGDDLEEILVTTYASDPPATGITLLDMNAAGTVSVTERNLQELNTAGYLARAFGTLALGWEEGVLHLVGAAKPESFCSNCKKLFACTVSPGEPAEIDLAWQTGWLVGKDFYGNMTGPSIADVDADPGMEVLYVLNGGLYSSEGLLVARDLSDGQGVYESPSIPFNPISSGGGATVKSQVVTGLTSSPGSGQSAMMAGFSTLCAALDPLLPGSCVPGFPAYSRDAAWSAPAVCDLDGDGSAELLHVDDSGLAVLFDLGEYAYTGNGWRMYQGNPRRTGLTEASGRTPVAGLPDLSLTPSEAAPLAHPSGPAVRVVLAVAPARPAPVERVPPGTAAAALLPPGERSATPTVPAWPERVEVAAFDGDSALASVSVRLRSGRTPVSIPLSRRSRSGEVLVVADPDGRVPETDEGNNYLRVTSAPARRETFTVATPARRLAASVFLEEPREDGVLVEVYSTAGRLVRRLETGPLPPGASPLDLEGAGGRGRLPAGMYVVRVSGLSCGRLCRKAVLLP